MTRPENAWSGSWQNSKVQSAGLVRRLGAILYECITGKLPRARKNVTVCLVAAGKNEIDPTEKKGELVDIALKAMAAEPKDRYASVTDFQTAIREYQSHSESIALAARAVSDLETARGSRDYRDFTKALYGFEEASKLWPENARAKTGIVETQTVYAECAYDKGDYDLGLSLLDPHESAHQELHSRLNSAQRERDARLQRLRTAKRIVLGLVAAVFHV